MVKIGPVVSELKWTRKLCCDSAKFSRFSFIWHTASWNGLEYCNFDL